MKFKKDIKEITDVNTLNEVVKIFNTLYYDTPSIMKEYIETETNKELKQQNKENDVILRQEIFYKKLSDELNFDHFKLYDNEFDISSDITNLIEELETDDLIYVDVLHYFKNYDLAYFEKYDISITCEYHIIIDGKSRKIYNLSEDNLREVIKKLLLSNDVPNNDGLLLGVYNYINDYNTILVNNHVNLFDLFNNFGSIDFLTAYNKEHKFIIVDNVHKKVKSVNSIDLTLDEIITEILQDNYEVINMIISYL